MVDQRESGPVEERCSLCGDSREQAGVLVEGLEDFIVCQDCLAVLVELLEEARTRIERESAQVVS